MSYVCVTLAITHFTDCPSAPSSFPGSLSVSPLPLPGFSSSHFSRTVGKGLSTEFSLESSHHPARLRGLEQVPLLCVPESWKQHGDDGVCASLGCGYHTWQPYRPQEWWMACVPGLTVSDLSVPHSPLLSSFRICLADTWMISYLSHILLSAFPSLSSVGSQCRATSLLFPQSKASGASTLGCQVAIRQFVIQDFSPPRACFMVLPAFSWAWPSLAHLFSSSSSSRLQPASHPSWAVFRIARSAKPVRTECRPADLADKRQRKTRHGVFSLNSHLSYATLDFPSFLT